MTDHVTAALAHKQASRAALHRALGGVPDAPAEPAPGSEPAAISFDGGARRDQPTPPPSEAEFMAGVFDSARRGSRPAPRW